MKEMNMKKNLLSYLMQVVRCFIKNKKTSNFKAEVRIPNRLEEKKNIVLKIDFKNENISSIKQLLDYLHVKKIYVIKLLPIAMHNFIIDGMDIRDYVGKYLSKETFNKFSDFVHEEMKDIDKRIPVKTENGERAVYFISRFGYETPFIFTYGADNKTYIQTGKFYYKFYDTVILNVDVFNEHIY